MNITECLTQITSLTRENLNILRALNDSLHTNKNHISVNVNGKNYAIPSYMSLENDINMLKENLNNVLNAPKTGEAFTYFDGTTQKLELSGYASTPPHIDLEGVKNFNYQSNNIFKDFMNPNPYIKLDIKDIPNNIKHVNVKKIVLKNPTLINLVKQSTSIKDDEVYAAANYSDIYKLLFNYKINEDYDDYDTIRRLPLRTTSAYGVYHIASINDEYQDSNFEEFYSLTLDEDLVYFINNGTIQRDIRIGDKLLTMNDKTQLEVVEVNPTSKEIKVKVSLGGYADLCDKMSNNPDLYTLKYYLPVDYDSKKYIEVPLEEDENIIVFIASINDTTNAQSPWGAGVYFNTSNLKIVDGDKEMTFREYYNRYVNNVGDALNAITHMMDDDAQIEKLTPSEFNTLKSYKPIIEGNKITVTQINKHLNDSKDIQAIRKLYDQKKQYKIELDTNQQSIDNVNKSLATVSFDDTTNTRAVYENQLSKYNAKKKELTESIASIISEIDTSVNAADVPIENAKYRIRGFVDVDKVENLKAKVIKIDVEYRYKNKNKFVGNAMTLKNTSFVYSDWNKMDSPYRKMIPLYENGHYVYKLEDANEDKNEVSFNQLDIPITQGESVDIRVRFIYNLGYPFAEMTSSWSPVFNQEFPKEYLKNVEVMDIIKENNSDAKKQQFIGLLDEKGIVKHVDDSIQDQTIQYFHKPEHISSGFYTPERRIIPLLDKLKNIDGDITKLMTEVYGAIDNNLELTISDNNTTTLLKPNIINSHRVLSYTANETRVVNDNVDADKEFAYSQLTLAIKNKGSFPIKLYSLFPGDHNVILNSITAVSRFNVQDYITDEGGIYMQLDEADHDSYIIPQHLNQFLYFRARLNGATNLYADDAIDFTTTDELQQYIKISANPNNASEDIIFEHRETPLTGYNEEEGINRAAFLFPYPGTMNRICINSIDNYIVIEPGASIILPISFYYYFDKHDNGRFKTSVTRSMAFDIRTSLFADPITYKMNIVANSIDTQNFKAVTSTKLDNLPAYNVTTTSGLSKKNIVIKH